MLRLTIDDYFSGLAGQLADEELRREVEAAQRAVLLSVRTRKDLAQHRLYCLQCELKKRAEARDQRNPGHA